METTAVSNPLSLSLIFPLFSKKKKKILPSFGYYYRLGHWPLGLLIYTPF